MIAHAGQIANAASADQHDAVFLEVVLFTRNIRGHFATVAQSHAGNLTKSRVRLLRRHRLDLKADAALLRAGVQVFDLIDARQTSPRLLDQLINRRHSYSLGLRPGKSAGPFWEGEY